LAFRVLDSSAFYAGIPFSSNEPGYITSLIYNEIEHIKKDHDAIQILIETKRLMVRDPEHRFIITVNDAQKNRVIFQIFHMKIYLLLLYVFNLRLNL